MSSRKPLLRCLPWLLAPLLGLGAFGGGCSDEPQPGPAEDAAVCEAGTRCPCDSPFDCPPGETCVGPVCVPLEPDLGDVSDQPDEAPDVVDVDLVDETVDPDLTELEEIDAEDIQDATDQEEEEILSCIDDNFDQPIHRNGNDTCNRAIAVATGSNADLVLCPDDPQPGQSYDYWSYTAQEHQQVSFFVQTEGVLTATLYDASCSTPPIAEAEATTGGYLVNRTTCGQETVKLLVDGNVTERTEYAVEIASERLACLDDNLEPQGDLRSTAVPVVPGTDYNLVFCDLAGEEDWYRFDVPDRGFRADITATYDAQAICNDLVLSLWPDGAVAATEVSTPIDTGTVIHTDPLEPGGYAIQVTNGEAAEGPYQFHLDLVEVANCTEFDVYHEPDNTEEQAQAAGMPITFDASGNLANPAQFADLIMCEDDEVDLFALAVAASTLVELAVEYTVADDPIRAWFYPQGDQPAPANRLVAEDGTFHLSHYSSSAATWFLRIEPGLQLQRNYYTITGRRSLCPFDEFELNNEPDSAYGFGPVTVNETGIGLCPMDDTVDWYTRPTGVFRNQQINVINEPGQPLDVSLYFAPFAPRMDHCAQNLDCEEGETCLETRGCAMPLVSNTVGSDGSIQLSYWTGEHGGDYLLAVQATDPEDDGEYGFRWSDSFTCPDDAFGENHDVGNPYPISWPPTGSLAGDLCVIGATGKDQDYFSVTVPANTQLQVSVGFEPGAVVGLQLPCLSSTISSSAGLISGSDSTGSSSESICFMVKGFSAPDLAGVVPYELLLTSAGIEETCSADSLEPNDSFATASEVNEGDPWVDDGVSTGDDLSICGSDRDYFEIYAVAGDTVVVDAMFDDVRGDLDLELWGPCQSGVCEALVAQASGPGDGASLGHTVQDTGFYVFDLLSPGTGLNQVYGLSVGVSYACESGDDPYEPNDTLEDAVADGPFETPEDLLLCSAGSTQPDIDWFGYYLLIGDVITIDATFEHYHGNVDMALWHEGQLVASSLSSSDSEHLEHTVVDPGDYQVEVFTSDGRDTPYRFQVDIERPPCPDDRMDPNDNWDEAPVIAGGVYENLALCPLTEDWLAIDVPAPTHLAVAMVSSPFTPEEDILLELYHEDDLPAGPPLVVSEPDRDLDVVEVEIGDDGLGTYLAHVSQPPEGELWLSTPYSLEVRQALPGGCPRDRFEPNDTGVQAIRLVPNTGVAAFACDDDWYTVLAFAGQTITARLDYSFSGGVKPTVALYLDPDEPPVAGPGDQYASYRAAATGLVYLLVSPQDSTRAYRLTVEADEADDVCSLTDPTEPDDTIGNASTYTGPMEGYLCDELDYVRISPTNGQDVEVRLTHPPTGTPPVLDMVNASEVLLGSATPSGVSFLSGWFTWLSTGSAYVRLADTGNEVNGPYWLEVQAFGPVAADGLEPNNSYGAPYSMGPTSVGVLLSDLSLSHHSDTDFYRFAGNQNHRVGAQVALNPGDDAILRLYGPDGLLLMESNLSSAARSKESVWAVAGVSGSYTIQVVGPTPAPARYTLRALNQVDAVCTDTGSNRSYSSAESISVGTSNASKQVCAGPGDWYRTTQTLVPGQAISISVNHDLLNGDLDLEIYGAEDEILLESHTLNALETLLYTSDRNAKVTFRVYVDDGGAAVPYQLSVVWGS